MPEGFALSALPDPVTVPAALETPCQQAHTPEPITACARTALTLFQANLLVAMLGGFWGRQADGHPGPDLLGRGLVILAALVRWERLNSRGTPTHHSGKDPPKGSVGAQSNAKPSATPKAKAMVPHARLL